MTPAPSSEIVHQAVWVDVETAAAYAGVSKRTIYVEVRKGHLLAARVNDRGDLRLSYSALNDWLTRSSQLRHPPSRRGVHQAVSAEPAP